MRKLVHDNEPLPAVVGLERGVGDGRREQDREAIGGIRRRKAVRHVDVVREREIDDAAGRMELRGQQPEGALRFGSSFNSDAAIARAEVDAEMLGVEGAPGP